MKDIVKSVKIVESKWNDEDYDVIVELHEAAGDALFKKINGSLERADSVAMVAPAPGYTTQVSTFDFGSRSFWVVDFDDSWYVIEEVLAPWRRVVIIMEGDYVCNLQFSFSKEKEGLDAFDYTDYHGIPDNAWIEPAKMIREILSSK